MIALPRSRNGVQTLADLMAKLGDIPADRILLHPAPGHATEADLLRLNERGIALCELVYGTLVEKALGFGESKLEAWIIHLLFEYLNDHDIGELVSGKGLLRLREGLVRSPDISFFTWEHATTPEEDRKNPIANAFPDVAIEVISPSNTLKELALKRKEYFKAGTTLVWQVYPKSRTVEVYTSQSRSRTLTMADTLDGGKLMPGLQIPLKRLFGRRSKASRRAE